MTQLPLTPRLKDKTHATTVMQALLLSPATRFLSPDSSSSLSPSTPPLPSLDFLSLDPDNTRQEGSDTPSHSSTTRSQSPQLNQSPTPTCAVELINKTPILPSTSTLPRVPSNLRYQYNNSQSFTSLSLAESHSNAEPETSESNHSTSSQSPPRSPPQPLESSIITHHSPPHNTSLQLIDFAIPPAPISPNTSSDSNSSSQAQGTFICNSVVVNSLHGGIGAEGQNDQLAAAVRAFKTPKTAGLFEGVQGDEEEGEGEEDEDEEEEKWRSKMGLGGKGKGKGLMRLFEPLVSKEEEKPKNLGTFSFFLFSPLSHVRDPDRVELRRT